MFLSTDCITLSEDLPCSGILKGQTETEALKQLSEYICTKFDSVTNFFELVNLGTTGARVYKGVSMLGKKELRRLVDSNLINIVEGVNDITISVDETALEALIATTTTADGSETKIISGTPNVVIEGNGTVGDEYVINVEVDGSETKINAGNNTTITGNGTTATPYVINSTDTNTTYTAGTGISLVGTTFNNILPDQIVDITGTGATIITGTYPNFTISSTDTNTTYSAGTGLSLTGTVFSLENLQKVITNNYTLTDADNEYTIFINNDVTAITISLGTITIPNFCVGLIQEGTADVTFTGVTNPTGLKSKGQGYQTFIERKLQTSTFYLLGNTKA